MNRLNKDIEVAVNLISKLGDTPKRVEDLCVELNTTKHFLERVAGKLRRQGLLVAVKGPGGGVKATEAEYVTLLSIYSALGHTPFVKENLVTTSDRITKSFYSFLDTSYILYGKGV